MTLGRFAPLPIAASRTASLGGTVATIGFPDIGLQGFSPKLAKGEIASLSGTQDSPDSDHSNPMAAPASLTSSGTPLMVPACLQ